ncbi:MAG: hypothetical protein WC712_10320 [Candidatus Brocadiia bacterium]
MKPRLFLMASLLVLCGCAGQGHVPAPARESALRPIIVDIVPSPYAQKADWSLCDNCLRVDGVTHSWEAFAMLLKQRAAAVPIDRSIDDNGPRACPIPVHIRADRDTPARYLHYVMTLCILTDFVRATLYVRGEPQEYRLCRYIPPELLYRDADDADKIEDDLTSDEDVPGYSERDTEPSTFYVSVFCLSRGKQPVWRVNASEYTDIKGMEQALIEAVSRAQAGSMISAYVGSDPDAMIGDVYEAYAVVHSAEIPYYQMAPPRIESNWPQGMLRACSESLPKQ